MPGPTALAQTKQNKGGSLTFVDYQGRTHSQSISGSGGTVSLGDMENLANKIALCSNACFNRVASHEIKEYNDADLHFYDEAEASVNQVMVIVLEHDTNPDLNKKVEIPAYDASLLMADMRTPDKTNAFLLDVVNTALAIANDDDNAVNPDNYHNWRAYTTTRKTRGARGSVRSLPAPEEPGQADNPPETPGV